MKPVTWFWLALVLLAPALRAEDAPAPATPAADEAPVESSAAPELQAAPTPAAPPTRAQPVKVIVIPVRDAIAQPVLYVLRRGLKEANATGAKAVVLDMETPGGSLGVALEIMEALDKFDGETITYVNKEAISAGAIISTVTDEIHFAPGAVIGAAAAVMSTGADIGETMQLKLNSYLKAKVRAFSEGKGYRGQVISSMIDEDYEFKIGDTVIKAKGELLSLTATEAAKTYGDPAVPLLSAGTHDTLEDLLAAKFGPGGYVVERLEVSWSEELAKYLTAIAPLLMGAGLLGLFIEFKTPGFGVFGIGGGLLLALAFFGHYAAGLSGHEAALVFVIGVLLVFAELLFFPGTIVAALTGVLLMLGALAWSMVDYWPTQPFEFSGDVLFDPLLSVALGLLIAVVGAVVLVFFMPRGWVWDRMILQAAAGTGADAIAPNAPTDDLVGRVGVATSALRPAGQIEIDGVRHEARVAYGFVDRGAAVRVTGRQGSELIVKPEAAA